MKILIIGLGKLMYMPYINFYLENINRITNEVHVAYWNRDEEQENLQKFDNLYLHEFKCSMVNDAPIREKINKFYKYRRFCNQIIKNNKFDKLIMLHSLSGLMLFDKLVFKFNGKYILDYRDSTFEKIPLFRFLVGIIVKKSKYTFVSSKGFVDFLPKLVGEKIYISHNLLEKSLEYRDIIRITSNKVRIAFWGFIREVEINIQIIDRIGVDNRLELHYYGREQRDALLLKKYTLKKGYKNIFFHGAYIPEDRYSFIKYIDFIHNIYNSRNMMLAMGNKYYDGIIFRIPQICMPNSHMAKMCENSRVGLVADPKNSDFCDIIFDYWKSYDYSTFVINADKELIRVMEEYNEGKK